MKIRFFWIVIFLFISLNVFCQSANDALLQKADSLKAEAYYEEANSVYSQVYDLIVNDETIEDSLKFAIRNHKLNCMSYRKHGEETIRTTEALIEEMNKLEFPIFSELSHAYHNYSRFLKSKKLKKEALNWDQNAIDLLQASDPSNHYALARAYYSKSLIYRSTNKEKEELLLLAIKHAEKIENANDYLLGDIYNAYGKNCVFNYKIQTAKKYLFKAREEYLKIYNEDSYSLSFVYRNLARCFTFESKYKESIEYNKETIRILKKRFPVSDKKIIGMYLNLASNYISTNMPEDAINYIEKSEEHLENLSSGYSIKAFVIKAQAYLLMEKYDEAEAYNQKALDINIKKYGPDNLYSINMYNTFGYIYERKKEFHKAIEVIKKAHKIQHLGENAEQYNDVRYPILLSAYTQLENWDSTLHYLNIYEAACLEIQKSDKVSETELLSNTKYFGANYHRLLYLNAKYKKLNEKSDLEEALTLQKKLYALFELNNADNIDPSVTAAYYNVYPDLFDRFVEINLAAYELEEDQAYLYAALSIIDGHKARLLKRNLSLKQDEFLLHSQENDFSKLNELETELASVRQRLFNANESQLDSLNSKLFSLKLEKKALTKTLSENFNWYKKLSTDFDFQISKDIDQSTAIIEFHDGHDHTWLFYLDHQGIQYKAFDKATTKFEENILALIASIKNPTSLNHQDLAKKVNTELFEGLEVSPKTDHLVIIPDGASMYLSFDVLLDNNGKYLFESKTIQYANSLRIFKDQKSSKSRNKNNPICFAPTYKSPDLAAVGSKKMLAELIRSGDYNLPGAIDESIKISELLNGSLFTGLLANEDNFKKEAPFSNLFHLAMHGITDTEDHLNSYLMFSNLANDSEEDNKLHTFEIYNMDLNADLAVLSACNTGVGLQSEGEGVLSLANAFHYAGVNSTVMSLWKVPDASTKQVMELFYVELLKKKRIDHSLAEAKKKYLSDETISEAQKHPYYWAGFIANGNMKPLSFSNSRFFFWGIGALVFLFLAFLLIKNTKLTSV